MEQAIDTKAVQRHQNIVNAAHMESEAVILALCKLIEHRQMIAQGLLRFEDEKAKEAMEELYDNVNNDIKKYLAL